MRKRTMFGSCVALVLAVAAVTAQQQPPAGNNPQSQTQPRTSATAGQPQEMTIVGCVEQQAGSTSAAPEFVLVSMDAAGAGGASSTVPSATGTTGTTSGRAAAGTRYSLSGTRERELRVGQRVEIVGKSSASPSTSPADKPGSSTPGQTGAGASATANMPMFEIVSFKEVPGNCNK